MNHIEKNHTARTHKPMRKAAMLAAAAAVLTVAAMAAGLAMVQGRMTFFTDREEAENAVGPHGYYDNLEEGARYDYSEEDLSRHAASTARPFSDVESWHKEMEYAEGGPDDGWTYRSTGLYSSDEEGLVRDTWYQGNSLSDLSGVWDTGLNMAWLDERYQPETEAHYVMTRANVNSQTPYYVEVAGQYRGNGEQVFKVWYQYDESFMPHDSAELTEYYEYYKTQDGVTIPLEMHHSETGKTLFTASLDLSKIRFAVIGTQMEVEELHTLLDSLNLSALIK